MKGLITMISNLDKIVFRASLALCGVVFPVCIVSVAQTMNNMQVVSDSRKVWIDPDTNHKVIQLTVEKDSRSLYFNENAFMPDGSAMVYWVSRNIYLLDMQTLKSQELIPGPITSMIVGKKSPTIFFTRSGDLALYAMDVPSKKIIAIAQLPSHSIVSTINSDETLAGGTYEEGRGSDAIRHKPDPNLGPTSLRANAMDERLAAHIPMVLFTINLKSGEIQKVLSSTDWLNHVQFSPTDPSLLMYCHEGLWMRVDRIWTVRTDGSHNQLIHQRTMNDEIAGHEFWDPDGKTIWYDLQVPRGQIFYVAGFNVETGARKWYSVDRDAWSIHYSVASDHSFFAGDGGDYSQVAKSKNGQWIELFAPHTNPAAPEIEQKGLVQSGFMVSQHLVNLSQHKYTVEPNVRFSPDHKLVIFTSNMLGSNYIFAVEVRHTKIDAVKP